jgi:predicted DNA-binding protein (UPF0251 family)/predicted Fe-Mo cluster-binding NifX family protein
MIDALPEVTYFKPRGVPMRRLNEVYLTLDGFEALRLADHEGLSHRAAAQQTEVSRQTFGRILSHARNTVTKALVQGMALCIQGGEYAIGQKSPVRQGTEKNNQPSEFNKNYNKEASMDKIAISSEGPVLDDLLDPRFGRAAGFIIVDPQSLSFEYIDNGQSQTMSQGAGIQAAENVARAGVKAVLTGYVGPKAFMALDRAGIQVAQNLENMTVREAIERFNQGNVTWASSPNRRGHGR